MKLTASEARHRFTAAPVARLATCGADGQPHVVPVTFTVDGDTVHFAVDQKPKSSRALRRLRNLRENPRAALLADAYAEEWAGLWWARADGEAEIREADAVALTLLRQKYPQYAAAPPEGPFVAIRVHAWTGWAAAG